MGSWSPMDAMKAYMHTLQLCKDLDNKDYSSSSRYSAKPECMEFISALAAGNKARLMIDVAPPGGSSPSILALAVAAKHTGGRLVCIRDKREALEEVKTWMECYGLGDAVEFELGDPCEAIKQYENIDFVVVDQRIRGCLKLLCALDMNPKRSVVVVCNLFELGNSYHRVVKSRVGVAESVTLPIGGGIEVTRIGSDSNRRLGRRRRTFVVYEN